MRALSALMPLWLVSPAQAADVYVTFIWGRPVIHVEGVILPGDEKKFAQFSYQYATVRPSGPGGEITTAIAIGKMIWERGYTTLLLRDDGQCNSACTTIWLSGRKAAVQINSALGFHSSFVAQTGEASEEGNQLIMAHLETVGLTHKQACMRRLLMMCVGLCCGGPANSVFRGNTTPCCSARLLVQHAGVWGRHDDALPQMGHADAFAPINFKPASVRNGCPS